MVIFRQAATLKLSLFSSGEQVFWLRTGAGAFELDCCIADLFEIFSLVLGLFVPSSSSLTSARKNKHCLTVLGTFLGELMTGMTGSGAVRWLSLFLVVL